MPCGKHFTYRCYALKHKETNHLSVLQNIRDEATHTLTHTLTNNQLCTCTKKEEVPQLCSNLLQYKPASILHIKITGFQQHAANFQMIIFLFPKKSNRMASKPVQAQLTPGQVVIDALLFSAALSFPRLPKQLLHHTTLGRINYLNWLFYIYRFFFNYWSIVQPGKVGYHQLV